MPTEELKTRSVADETHYDKAAKTYRKGRLNYDQDLILEAYRAAGADPEGHVLDLGCGPGTIANEVSKYCGSVLGVDISSAMVADARSYARENTRFIQGSSDDMSFIDRPLDMVTFGRSFHWMDREKTLEILDEHVKPDGCLAFFYVGPMPGKSASHRWWGDIVRMSNALGKGRLERSSPLAPDAEREEFIMARSAFSDVRFSGKVSAYYWTLDQIVAWILSRYNSGVLEGEELEQKVRAEAKKTLKPYGDGPWRTFNQHRMIIAKRPA